MQNQQVILDDQWIKSVQSFNLYLADISTKMDVAKNKIASIISSYKYLCEQYIKQWQLMQTKIKKQQQIYKKNGSQILLSTVFNWFLPGFCCSYNLHYLNIKKILLNEDLNEQFQQLLIEFKQQSQKHQNKKISNEEHILSIPLIFIVSIIPEMQKIKNSLVQHQVYVKKLAEANPQKYKKPWMRAWVQNRQFQQSLEQWKSTILHLTLKDSQQKQINRQATVIRNKIISNQYLKNPIVKKKSTIFFVWRLKLVFRWKALQKRVKKLLQKRKQSIFQIIDGQKNYIQGLNQYMKYIKQPIQKLQMITDGQRRLLFSSIKQIKDFHESMYNQLSKAYQKYSDNQQYGKLMKIYFHFFKLYTDYILNAQQAQKLLQQLQKKHKQIGQLAKKYKDQTNKISYNELMQPTFKIARYQMLLDQVIKNTSKNHSDYIQLVDCKNLFKKILTQVNNQVDKIIRRNRLNQLQTQFLNEQIFKEGRQFLAEYNLVLIKQPSPTNTILIIFNDLVLILDQNQRKIMKKLIVNQQFFARRQEDNKIYRNMITIHSDGFFTFTVGPQQINIPKAEQIFKILKSITKDNGQQVYVQVIGTQQIGSTSFSKYTQYIVEIKYLDLKKILHLRCSWVNKLVGQMQKYYQNNLKIQQKEDVLKKNIFNSHKSKVIQERKITIAQILMKMFNSQIIKQKPEYFLKQLNLPQNFYDLARISYEKRLSIPQLATISGIKRASLNKKQLKQAFTLLCATQLQLGKDIFHDVQNSKQIQLLKSKSQKISIKVQTVVDNQPVIVKITDFDTVQDVCNKVSKLIGLRSNRDFRLFHEIGKKQLRVLQHEQILTKIFKFPKIQNTKFGFLNGISTFLSKFEPDISPTLIFKKYYYLPMEIQLGQARKDLIRLRLLVFQVFVQIRQMKYHLNYDEYLLFLAMLLYIKLQGNINQFQQLEQDIVHFLIPQTIFKLKNHTEIQWLASSRHHLKRLRQQIDKVIAFNREQLKSKKIKVDTVSKDALYFGHKHLCSQIVLNKIKTNPIFGSNIFYVQPHQNCYEKLQKKKLKVAYNMWLAVKVESIQLLTPSSKQSILKLNYNEIQKVEVYSQSVVFITSGHVQQQYRLNTYQSFQISQLYKYNKAMNSCIQKLATNSQLNIKVKSYRDQLNQHRYTFEQVNGQSSMII